MLNRRPLTWGTLTEPSKIMIPTYVAAQLWLGAAYMFDPGYQVLPSLALARQVMAMGIWGGLYWVGAAMLVGAFLTRRRWVFALVLYMVMVASLGWAVLLAGATAITDSATWGAPAWPCVVAAASFATARAVLSDRKAPA